MNAIILAAGEGKRLMPLTERTPKALISIRGIPLLKNHLDKLLDAGFQQIAVTCYTHAEQIASFVKQNYSENAIVMSRESQLLGTGGGIKQAISLMEGTEFLIINADIFSDIDYSELRKDISPKVFAVQQENGDFGIVDNKVNIAEDPTYTFTGISIINKALVDAVHQTKFDYWKDLLKPLAQEGNLNAEIISSNWYDVGTIEVLDKLNYE
jgi:MurNAc alpha-1-phosphate uridylyltransferase